MITTAALLALAAAQVSAIPPMPPAIRAIDAKFICPERLSDNAMRMTLDQLFVEDMRRAAPSATDQEIGSIRIHMLRTHHCRGWKPEAPDR